MKMSGVWYILLWDYCNELLRECTEGKLQSRGLWEEMKDDYEKAGSRNQDRVGAWKRDEGIS